MIQWDLVTRYACDKLRDSSTYIVTVIVGGFINFYGQLIVPMVRGDDFVQAMTSFATHFAQEPVIISVSVVLGFVFPFFVGVLTAVITRYANREMESLASFPESKPDPVFRADQDGNILTMGHETTLLFEEHGITSAKIMLGEQRWQEILSHHQAKDIASGYLPDTIQIGKDMARFLVAYVVMPEYEVNIYMTRLP